MSDASKEDVVQGKEKNTTAINVSQHDIFILKLLEFDKKISEAEMEVARLKSMKANFIYDGNVQQAIANNATKKE